MIGERLDGPRLAFSQHTIIFRMYFSAGLQHGLQLYWHACGQLRERAEYVDGVRHGTSVTWFRHGITRSIDRCAFGICIGAYKRWNSDGVLVGHVLRNGGKKRIEMRKQST